MENTTEARHIVLKKRAVEMPGHWSFTTKPFQSIAEASNHDEFKRARDVDWAKVEEMLGNITPLWPYDAGCFLLTQEDRIKKAYAEEQEAARINEGEPDWGN